jgi:hypothetical protein
MSDAVTMDADAYLDEYVDPTVVEFGEEPASRRRAFIACVVVFHTVDYLAMRPGSPNSQNLRNRLREKNSSFAIVERAAHAFKHGEAGDENAPVNKPLRVEDVISRPAMRVGGGGGQAGISQVGDGVGGVQIWKERGRPDLLFVVREAVAFLRLQTAKPDNA